MEPVELILENFMIHRYTHIDCTKFDVVLILGPNGAGKSVIHKAIEFVLFGEYNGLLVNDIIRDDCDKCKVTLVFNCDLGIFKIERTRNRKSNRSELKLSKKIGDNWCDDFVNLNQRTTGDVEAELAKIIKINFKTFRNSSSFSQNDLRGIGSAPTSQARYDIVKESINGEIYENLLAITKKDLSDAETKYKNVQCQIEQLKDLNKEIESIKEKNEKNISNIEIILKDKSETESILANTKNELVHWQSIISTEMRSLREEICTNSKLIKEAEDKQKYSFQILNDKTNILYSYQKQLKNKTEYLNSIKKSLIELNESGIPDLQVLKNELIKLSDSEHNGKIWIDKVKNKISELSVPLPDGSVCPNCRLTLSNMHKAACQAQINKELSETKSKLTAYQTKLSHILLKKKELNNQITDFETRIIKINSAKQLIQSKEEDLLHFNNMVSDTENFIKNQLQPQCTRDQNNLIHLEIHGKELQKKLSKYKLYEIETNISTCEKNISTSEVKLNLFLEKIAKNKAETDLLKRELEKKHNDLSSLNDLKIKIQEHEKQISTIKNGIKSFHTNGIPNMIVSTMLNDLEIESNILLNDIYPELEIKFDLSNGWDIIYNFNGKLKKYNQLSGGQWFILAFVYHFALIEVILKRLGTKIKFIMLDEVDMSLDKIRLETFIKLIKKWQYRYKMFIITHNDVLKEKFNNIILVEPDKNNGSTAKLIV